MDELDEALGRFRRAVIARAGSDELWVAVKASGADDSGDSYKVAREHLRKRSVNTTTSKARPTESDRASALGTDLHGLSARSWANVRVLVWGLVIAAALTGLMVLL